MMESKKAGLLDEKALDTAYEDANKDPDRVKILKNCSFDDITALNNGEDWEWLKNHNNPR